MRIHERISVQQDIHWDYFTANTGAKKGFLANLSKGGCLLRTSEIIEHRRWLRIMIPHGNVLHTMVGRVTRCENVIEAFGVEDLTLYRYGIEFTYPGSMSDQEADLILALSSRNLTVRSCLMRNSKSSRLP